MVAALLISDLHLDPSRPQLTALLLVFLATTARSAPQLYVLGDLFEAWIGDDDENPLHTAIADAFAGLAAAGTTVSFMHGNRDFLLGRVFAERCRMRLLPDPAVVRLGGIDTLLSHGDRYCSADVPYQAFRRQVRDPDWQREFLARPLADRRLFAEQARLNSAAHQQRMDTDLADVVDADVLREMQLYGLPRLIHGHTHRPARHQLGPDGGLPERIVLADWRTEGEALVVSESGAIERLAIRGL